jgi:hypothetical protein
MAGTPSNVQQDADEARKRAEEIRARRGQPPRQATPPPAPPAPPAEPATPGTPEGEALPGTPPPTETPADAPAGSQTPPADERKPADELAEIEARIEARKKELMALDGQWGGKLGELKGQVDRMGKTMSELARENAALLAKAAQPPATEATPGAARAAGDISDVSAEDQREYGTGFWTSLDRFVRFRIAQGAPRGAESDLKPIREKVQQLDDAARLNRFWLDVEALHPGARKINAEGAKNGWAEFLDRPIRAGGSRTNRADAVEAMQAGDVADFVSLLEQFAKEKAKSTAVVPVAGPPQNPNERQLEAQVMPRRVPGAQTPPSTARGPKTYTQSQYAEFWDDKTKHPEKHSPQEWDKLAEEMRQAARQGRVLPG